MGTSRTGQGLIHWGVSDIMVLFRCNARPVVTAPTPVVLVRVSQVFTFTLRRSRGTLAVNATTLTVADDSVIPDGRGRARSMRCDKVATSRRIGHAIGADGSLLRSPFSSRRPSGSGARPRTVRISTRFSGSKTKGSSDRR